MKSGIRKAALFLAFLLTLAAPGLALPDPRTLLALGFYAAGSAKVLIKTFAKRPGESYAKSGWGNGLAAFPASWQRWLLGEPRK